MWTPPLARMHVRQRRPSYPTTHLDYRAQRTRESAQDDHGVEGANVRKEQHRRPRKTALSHAFRPHGNPHDQEKPPRVHALYEGRDATAAAVAVANFVDGGQGGTGRSRF